MTQSISTPMLAPKIDYCERKLIINDQVYLFHKSPITGKLILSFINAPNYCISRDDLIINIYSHLSLKGKSERFINVQSSNLNKIISRNRRRLENFFNRSSFWIEFFVFDEMEKKYHFFRLRHNFLVEQIEEFHRNIG